MDLTTTARLHRPRRSSPRDRPPRAPQRSRQSPGRRRLRLRLSMPILLLRRRDRRAAHLGPDQRPVQPRITAMAAGLISARSSMATRGSDYVDFAAAFVEAIHSIATY